MARGVTDEELVRAYIGASPNANVHVNPEHVRRLRAVAEAVEKYWAENAWTDFEGALHLD